MPNVYAQPVIFNTAIAEHVDLVLDEGQEVRTGMIVVFTNDGYKLSSFEYDKEMIGVIDLEPEVEVEVEVFEDEKFYPVVQSGITSVLVNTDNGQISVGDFVTTSNKIGIGMKAEGTGSVLGQAIGATNDQVTEPQLIKVSIDFNGNLDVSQLELKTGETFLDTLEAYSVEFLNIGTKQAYAEPNKAFRYILAIAVSFIFVLFGFVVFGRIALRGIEALGRNPLARSSILMGVFINSGLALAVILVGLFLAFLIITL